MAEGDPNLREHLETLIAAERELREAKEEGYDERLASARAEIDRRFESVETQDDRISLLENFRENVTGRFVAVGVVGAIFIAVVSAVITRLILGGP